MIIIAIAGQSGNPVAAVGEALAPPTVNVTDPEILRGMVLPERFDDLKTYLASGKTKRKKGIFDCVHRYILYGGAFANQF